MEPWREREIRRHDIIDRAVEAADRIIMDGSDGTMEETNYLTARVAEKFMDKAIGALVTQQQRADFEVDHPRPARSAGERP